MKILYHHRTQASDAQGIHISKIVEAFQNLGHQVKVVSLVSEENLAMKKEKKLFGLIARFSPKLIYELLELIYNFYAYFKLSHEIKSFQPDFIYERYALYNFVGVLCSRKYNIPLILEVNSPIALEKKKYDVLIFSSLATRLEKWILANASKTVVVSNVLKKYFITIGISEEKLEIIPNGIDPTDFKEESYTDKNTIRSKYGLEKKIIIGFVGWLREWHKINTLLEILEEKELRKKNLHLLIVGDGPALPLLKKYVETHSLDTLVTFTGPVSHKEVKDYITIFDIAIIVHCTFYASPMKLFEYMTMAKPVIAPRIENIQEILTDGENSLLFNLDDKEDLKKAISTLASDSQLRERMGMEAKNTIYHKGYLWENNAKRIIEIYKASQNSLTQI